MAEIKKMNRSIEDKKYNEDKWRSICEVTLNNYINIKKRLKRREVFSNNILIYYSIFLIICSLTSKFFSLHFNTTLGEYFGIVISVVLLAFSLINNNARYSERIRNMEKSINELKTLKRLSNSISVDEFMKIYDNIVDNSEMREDVDFFITVKHLCKQNNISCFTNPKKIILDNDESLIKLKNYLCEINSKIEQGKIIIEYIWYLLLFLAPIVIFLICIFIKY